MSHSTNSPADRRADRLAELTDAYERRFEQLRELVVQLDEPQLAENRYESALALAVEYSELVRELLGILECMEQKSTRLTSALEDSMALNRRLTATLQRAIDRSRTPASTG
jgi:hypothetical protein